MSDFAPIAEITDLIARRGYGPVPYGRMDGRSGFYCRKSDSDFHCFAYFRYLPKHRTYDVTLGVQSDRVREYLGQALKSLYGEDFAERFLSSRDRPCLSMFNADALVGWVRGEMSIVDESTIAKEIEDLFRTAIEPVFAAVREHGQLLKLLLQVTPSFEWWRSSVSPRLAQIVVLAVATNGDWPSIRERCRVGEQLLANDSLAGSQAKFFVDDLHSYCSEHPLSVVV